MAMTDGKSVFVDTNILVYPITRSLIYVNRPGKSSRA